MKIFKLLIAAVLSSPAVAGSSCYNINVNDHILFNKRLTSFDFFNFTSRDLHKCAQQCMRRTRCKSFNYEQTGRVCVLNNGTWTGGTKLIDARKWLYSAITDWPSSIEPECFSRPCTDDEICVPGLLTGSIRSSYTCLTAVEQASAPLTTTTAAAPVTESPVTTTTITAAPTTSAAMPTTTTTTDVDTMMTTALTTTTLTVTTTITTTPAPTTSTTTAQTYGLRLVGGSTASEGRLEMLKADYDPNWGTVQLEDGIWNWKTTAVVCRQLGFQYGGSYHERDKPFARGSNKSYKLINVDCAGTETSLFDCAIGGYIQQSTNDYDIGITCFTEDVDLQGYGNINLVDGSGDTESNDGYLMIRYQNTWTRVCDALIGNAPDVFCKTISQGTLVKDDFDKVSVSFDTEMWVKKIDCKYEEVPHPFFCKNEGWRLESCGKSATLSCKP